MDFEIIIADVIHYRYAKEVCELIEKSAQQRGTGIAKRDPKYILEKMKSGKAIIALCQENLAGFCYIETWDDHSYVANSGLIVAPNFRNNGLAKAIKKRAFDLSQSKYPDAKIFGITTSLAVMKINSELGYKPVTFSELTNDPIFWKACESCPNYDILQRNQKERCLCTGMLANPQKQTMKVDLSNLIILENKKNEKQ